MENDGSGNSPFSIGLMAHGHIPHFFPEKEVAGNVEIETPEKKEQAKEYQKDGIGFSQKIADS